MGIRARTCRTSDSTFSCDNAQAKMAEPMSCPSCSNLDHQQNLEEISCPFHSIPIHQRNHFLLHPLHWGLVVQSQRASCWASSVRYVQGRGFQWVGKIDQWWNLMVCWMNLRNWKLDSELEFFEITAFSDVQFENSRVTSLYFELLSHFGTSGEYQSNGFSVPHQDVALRIFDLKCGISEASPLLDARKRRSNDQQMSNDPTVRWC